MAPLDELGAEAEVQLPWSSGGVTFSCSHCKIIISSGAPIYMRDDQPHCSLRCRQRGRLAKASSRCPQPKCDDAGLAPGLGLRKGGSSKNLQSLSRRETASLELAPAEGERRAGGLLARGLGLVGMVLAESIARGGAGGNCPRRAWRACAAGPQDCSKASPVPHHSADSPSLPAMFLDKLAKLLRPAVSECSMRYPPDKRGWDLSDGEDEEDDDAEDEDDYEDEEDGDNVSPLGLAPQGKRVPNAGDCFFRGVSDASTASGMSASRQTTMDSCFD